MSAESNAIQVKVPAQLSHLVPTFLANREKDLGLARAAWSDQQWDQLAMMGHRLYGTAASYGFAGLAEIGRAMEAAAATRAATAMSAQLTAWQDYLEQVEVVYTDN